MRYGIIGSNFITDTFLDALVRCGGTVGAYYSRDLARAQERAAAYGAKAFDDLEAFAADDSYDIGYVASPNSLHAEQSILLLQHGKHVLCEKPIARNLPELRRMYEAADQAGRVLLDAMRPVFHPGMDMIRREMATLGTIRRVNFHYHQTSSRYEKLKAGIVENAFRPEMGGGALMDIGVYCASLLIDLFGPPHAIDSRQIQLHTGVDGQGVIIAQYPDMLAELSYSKICTSYEPSCIQGEAGTILLPHVASADRITVMTKDGERVVSVDAEDNSMVYEIRAMEQIIADPPLEAPHRKRTIELIKLLDAARKHS